MATHAVSDAGRIVFEYLYLRDGGIQAADAVIGFGHFDMKIPRRCLELYRQGRAPLIVLAGGMGAGTADLGRPEARAFLEEIDRLGGAPGHDLLFEDRSTNTGENVHGVTRLLEDVGRPLGGDDGVRSALVVANACRQRRVYLTCRQHHPGVRWLNAPPETTFADERAMYAEKGEDLLQHLAGEVRRLLEYPGRGFCEATEVSRSILEAHQRLVELAGG